MDTRSGFTLVEMLVVLAVVGILLVASSMLFQPSVGSLQDGASLLQGFFAQARARAMATTSACRVRPATATRLIAESASSCEDTSWAPEESLTLDLPRTVSLPDTSWSVCFGNRGISDQNLVVSLRQDPGGTKRVEVLLGGTAKVLP